MVTAFLGAGGQTDTSVICSLLAFSAFSYGSRRSIVKGMGRRIKAGSCSRVGKRLPPGVGGD